MKTVLFVHQSAEMYGSDKVLLYLVVGLRDHGVHPVVLLPEQGPLLDALQAAGIEAHIAPVAKLDRRTLSVKGLLRLPLTLLRSIQTIDRVVKGSEVDLVYSNTLAVLGSAVWALFRRKPHVWHVHEILLSPTIVRRGFPLMTRLLADRAICNSSMTLKWLLDEQPKLASKSVVIWNGQGPRPQRNVPAVQALRQRLGLGENQLLVSLVGRINRWKGQSLLIEVAGLLAERGHSHVHFLIVGSAFAGHEGLVDELQAKISRSGVSRNVHILSFTSDIWSVWDATDIAVVPSTEPEPFGMVAIEAMASSCPVVVAAHGGLLDIVEDGVSGLHFKPGDATDFANQLERLVSSVALRESLGQQGCIRQKQFFTLQTQVERTALLIESMTQKEDHE